MTSTYAATAHRSGEWWAIEVTKGLDDNTLGVTQTRRLGDIDNATRELIAELVDTDVDEIDVEVDIIVGDELSELVALFRHADSFEAAARTEAAAARSWAAAGLLRSRLTMREAGQLLGVSHQRIKQLADRAPDHEPATLVDDLHRSSRQVTV